MRPTGFLVCLPLAVAGGLVGDLTKSEFGSLHGQSNLALVAFSSRTYDAVQPFSAVLEEVAAGVNTPTYMVNCDEEKELCKEHDVNAYPTLRLFKKLGTNDDEEPVVMRYRGRRTSKAIRSFVTKHELPTVSHVDPAAQQSFKEIDDVVVVAYLQPDPKGLLATFRDVAAKHSHEAVFGHVDDISAADAEGLTMPSIVLYKNADGDHQVLNDHFSHEDLEALLETAKTVLIGDFSERTMADYMVRNKLTVYVFVSTEREATQLRHELTPVAKKLQQYVIFGMVDATEFAPMAQNFDLQLEKGLPALVVHAPMNDNVFHYAQGRVIEGSVVEAMLMTILEGRAQSGQMFGEDAAKVKAEVETSGHDEL